MNIIKDMDMTTTAAADEQQVVADRQWWDSIIIICSIQMFIQLKLYNSLKVSINLYS